MPVGTVGSVKGVQIPHLKNDIKAQIILGNTYHLYLRPGLDILQKAGGLHKFNAWDRPILTDSGGFQVFSLKDIRKMSEEGVEFRSHIDGSKHFFSPESVMDRCINRLAETEPMYGYEQQLFPIVQGCVYPDLRRRSAEYIASKGAAGNAIGGLAVGEPAEKMYEMIEVVNEILPTDRPRYLMGVGTPANILEAIERGVDMFDCVMPTRNGRNAMLFTKHGIMNMRNEKWKYDFSPIEEDGASFVDTLYSKAYLRHLFAAQELLALEIASIHNLAFYVWLTQEARKHILADDYASWKKSMLEEVTRRL